MISEFMVLASCMMLSTSQPQIPIQRVADLPNLHPMQMSTLPNSQLLMMQSAHSILNQDASAPIAPGILGGVPVIVSEAVQNILNQESSIVGYNFHVPETLQTLFQQESPAFQQNQGFHQNRPSPFLSPPSPPKNVKHNTQHDRNVFQTAQRPNLQNLMTIPVMHSAKPQRATTSTTTFVPVKSVPFRATVKVTPFRNPSESVSFASSVSRQPINTQNVYYDIPPNHPVPPPLSPSSQTHEPSSGTQEILKPPLPYPVNNGDSHTFKSQETQHTGNGHVHSEDVVYMRPPSSFTFQEFYRAESSERHQEPERGRAESYQENPRQTTVKQMPSSTSSPSKRNKGRKKKGKSLRNKNTKRRSENNSTTTTESSKAKYRPIPDSIESSSDNVINKITPNSDSEVQSSEHLFLSTLLQSNTHSRNTNLYNSPAPVQGYSSGPSAVHKHIYVHAAPETYNQGPGVRVIRPAINQEKHVQIIFVKSPTEAPPPETVVELPPAQQSKTFVYVLSKKQEDTRGVKVISPPSRNPPAPEIYFIRYGDRQQNQGYPVKDLYSLNSYNSNYKDDTAQPIPVDATRSYNSGLHQFLRGKRHNDYGLDVYAPLTAYSNTGQINEITHEEADLRRSKLDDFF